jgi:DNA-binding response OmpR family regulator
MLAERGLPTDRGEVVLPPLVLIVDDFEDNRDMYADYLRFQGFRVAVADSGEDAVELARSLVPDVVVMDLSLPGIDGFEATRQIRATKHLEHVRVIALTGHSDRLNAPRAREVGCNDFIEKPCLPADLVARVRAQLAPG